MKIINLCSVRAMGAGLGFLALASGAHCAAAAPMDIRFERVWEGRNILDAALPFPEGVTFVAGAEYRARVDSLPAELRIEGASGEVMMRFAAPTNVAPPFTMHVAVTGANSPAVFATKDGKTELAYIARKPGAFEPRRQEYARGLSVKSGGGAGKVEARLSPGVGQADVRFVTWGREGRPYIEDGRLYFTFSARFYASVTGVGSLDAAHPERGVRFEGVILYDYGDGLFRNDLAPHIFYDDVAGEWRGWACNFSTGSDKLGGRAKGGVNAVWSKASPLHGLSIMRAKSLGLEKMHEDPCVVWDPEAKKWRMFVCRFVKGIKAVMMESDRWDGGYREVAGPVAHDSTGTTIAWAGGTRYCLSGSSDLAYYVYSYPALEELGKMSMDPTPWGRSSGRPHGRGWPAFVELTDGYPHKCILLTMDRENFPGMPKPNWTYGGLHIYVPRADGAGDVGRNTVISLAGRWNFALGDSTNCADTIMLPSTTDIARKGKGRIDDKNVEEIDPERDDAAVTSRLTRHPTRRFPYVGPATYEREIDVPSEWAGRRVEILLERTKKLDAYIDGRLFARSETLAAPARLELPAGLKPGRHRLRLVIDNSQKAVPASGHQISDDTQTNWNGIMGRMEMRSFGAVSIAQVKTFPDAFANKVTAKVVFRNDGAEEAKIDVHVDVSAPTGGTPVVPVPAVGRSFAYVAPCGVSTGEFTVALGPDAPKWSEFDPILHTLTVTAGESVEKVKFGLRDFRANGTQFTLNGRTVFLRGTHDACVWPLTGAAPMEVEPWRKYFATLKEYGLNHVRFHSWCPPEAAFEAADEAGFFMQPEYAVFGGNFAKDKRLRQYCLAESKRIIDAYGNHPSFVMFTLGNECRGGRPERAQIVRALRAHDPRPLYAIATNGDWNAPRLCDEDDFWATFRSCDGAEGNVRGSYAHCNAPLGAVQLPGGGTMRDFSSAVRHSPIPLIGHETGQFQAYPDYSEIPKYTGVLRPLNLEVFQSRLEKAGLGKYAADFCRASGRLMAINYREEMEEAFRTPGFGGFQLLDIQDFPGQGTALVGILNAFMESKGFITPEEWRMSCSPTVLLARFPRYTYAGGEKFRAEIQIAHYGREDVLTGELQWRIVAAGRTGVPSVQGDVVATGRTGVPPVRVGDVKTVGKIEVELPRLPCAERFELQLSFADGAVRNSYPLWVYPDGHVAVPADIAIVRDIASADRALAEGCTALCILDKAKAPTNSVPGFFASDFWNWEMFNGPSRERKVIAPGTLGLLVKEKHPALAGFPTSFHSDYQWRELIFNGVNVVLDGDKEADVIVRGIDNITRNQNLGVIWEKRRGKGRAVYCAIDLDAAKALPEARALRRSLLEYMSGRQ